MEKHSIPTESVSFERVLGITLFITLPATAGLMALAYPIVKIFFQRGDFTAAATGRTAAFLCMYAAGVWTYSVVRLQTVWFYARREFSVPLKMGLISLGTNFILGFVFMQFWAEAGLGLALSGSGISNMILLGNALRKRNISILKKNFLPLFSRLLLLAMGMGGLVWGVNAFVEPLLPNSFWIQIGFLIGLIGLGAGLYLMGVKWMKISCLADVKNFLRTSSVDSPLK